MQKFHLTLVACLALVVCGMAVVQLFSVLQSPSPLAQAEEAVPTKPWIHAKAVAPIVATAPACLQQSELWMSMERGVSATRLPNGWVYDDHDRGVRYQYNSGKEEVCRFPLPEGMREEFSSMQKVFQAVFRGEPDLGPQFAGGKIVRQKRRQVERDGQKCIVYELDVSQGGDSFCVTILVDTQSLLPRSMTMSLLDKKLAEFHFDYPQRGPADVYALGIPRSAKLVDHMPPAELGRLVKEARLGRDQFDPYYAVVAETYGMKQKPTKAVRLFQVWYDGRRWRVESGEATGT